MDFDNFQIPCDDFLAVALEIQKGLERQGLHVEMKNILLEAYHCHIRFRGVLFEQGLSGYREEKILIRLDTEAQHFDYQPEIFILNKFDVTSQIFITPIDILLSQKFTALLQRKRSKGRDFFDIAFLLSKSVKPNYNYLKMKLDISTSLQLLERVHALCAKTNFEEMVVDVRSFLFHPNDENKIRLFLGIVEQADLG